MEMAGVHTSNELEARADIETGETMDVQIPPPPLRCAGKGTISPRRT